MKCDLNDEDEASLRLILLRDYLVNDVIRLAPVNL